MVTNPYLPEALPVISVKPESAIDWTFRVAYEKPLIGGQFLELSIPGVGEAPISISDFGPGYLDLTIRKVGRLTDRIFNLKPGDTLFARGPYGNGFDLKQYESRHLIIVAGGTGLAPVKNVVSYFAANPQLVKSFTLIAGFKSPDDILFHEDLKKWEKQLNLILTVDRPAAGWSGRDGLVTKYIDELEFASIDETEVIVVGPPMMMKFATLGFCRKGLPKQQIWVSFERKMSCGIGKCGHCKIDETYVCLDGPVFNYTKAKKLLD